MYCSEIFGPLLPIVPVADLEEAIAIINSKDHALVAYIFSKDNATKETCALSDFHCTAHMLTDLMQTLGAPSQAQP